MKKKRIITIGEILLRLSSPIGELFKTTRSFNANYGGSEANVAIALANMGVDTSFLTVLPNNDLSDAVVRVLRANNVDTSKIILSDGRLGTYYLQPGAASRASKVIYDRAFSAFSEYDYSSLNLEEILSEYDWIHLSGITPALSESCRHFTQKILEIAKSNEITISFDGNYRANLWDLETARKTLTEYLPYINVLIGVEPFYIFDENGDAKVPFGTQPTYEQQKRTFDALEAKYPNIHAIIKHNRISHSASHNSLKVFLYYKGNSYESRSFDFDIVDRVGGGDALTAGFIYALMHDMEPQQIMDYSLATSVLKHTSNGDFSTFTSQEILPLCNSDYKYDVRR
ncbi:MAG: sugar kinase [Clostridia bacterium]|nr:sugar kinase [Clostridia bacterium]